MKKEDIKTLTIVGNLVIVDGESYEVDIALDTNISAVQYHNGYGLLEEPLMEKVDISKYEQYITKWELAKKKANQPNEWSVWDGDGWVDDENLKADIELNKRMSMTITLRQAREVVIRNGLFTTVETYINNIEDETERLIARNYWEYSEVFERSHPILLQLTGALGITEEQLDNMFLEGSKL